MKDVSLKIGGEYCWQVNFMRVYLHICEVFLLPSCEPARTRDCSSAEGVLCKAKYGAKAELRKAQFLPQAKMAPKKEPKFSSVKWAKSSCEEGQEIELTANVQDITDGNMVTL